MNRIISPLNVASFVFFVLAVWFVSDWHETKEHEEVIEQQKDYVVNLQNHTNDILDDVQKRLPYNVPSRNRTIQKIDIQGDTVFMDIVYMKPQIFYAVTENNSPNALLTMMRKNFGSAYTDLMLLKKYNYRIRTHKEGKVFENFVVTSDEFRRSYDDYYADEMLLKGYSPEE